VRRVVLLAVMFGLAAPAAHANVLVIGMDGTRWDKLQDVLAAGKAPNLKRLMRRGIGAPTQLDYTPPAAFTVSEVGWATIASGVNPNKHMVTGPLNSDPDQQTKNGHPDFLSRIEELAPALHTFSVTDWGNLGLHQSGGPIFSDAIDTKHATAALDTVDSYDAEDQADADAAVRILTDDRQDAGFVYFGLIDEVAHAQGSATKAYTDAIATTDRRIGQVLRAARRWTVIVTTDHGQQDLPFGSPLSHGGPSSLERTSFVIAAGPGIASDPRLGRARVVDIHPTVLARVGLPGVADLDGVPFATSTIEDATSYFGRQSARRAVQLRLSRAAVRRRALAIK
jgi:predicted AlkP superfamily pyrophosphatase or phosphodiesterase